AQSQFAASSGIMSSLAAGDGRATGAIVDAILVLPALGCSCYHFYELSNDPSGDERSNAIIEETANMISYVSRVSYAVAVNNTADPDIQGPAIGVMAFSNVCYGGLQVAEAAIGMG